MSKTFIFTVTTGRSGTGYLTRLLSENLVDADVHHERLGYQAFGVDTPDASHFTLFNSVGNVVQVRDFWRQKLTRIAKTPADTYAEISHFNAKAGLIENLGGLHKHGEVHLILLYRDPLATLRSFHNRHDFANLGFTWLFALDPGYPNKIVPADEHLKLGAAGAAYWYIQEMTARSAYYERLSADLPGVYTHRFDLEGLADRAGANDLLQQLGVDRTPDLIMPERQNATEVWQLDKHDERLLQQVIQQLGTDCRALGEAYFNSGRRLSQPDHLRKQTTTIVISPTAARTPDNNDSVQRARQLVTDGSYAEARPILEILARQTPPSVAVLELLGATLYYLGDLDAAHERLAAAYEIDPVFGSIRVNLAATLLRLDRADDALIYALEANVAAPDDGQAWLALGNAHAARGEPDLAAAALERALTIDQEDIDALSTLNKTCFDANRVDAALVYGERALRARDRRFSAAFEDLAHRFELRLKTARSRRSGRNVIAFTLWGDKPIYTEGMVQNAGLARDLYAGWECRLYHDGSVKSDLLDRLVGLDVACVRVNPTQEQLMGTFWRFLASDDPEVDRFVCRDADARLSARERAAVAAWEESEYPFHIIRDHPIHVDLMLAGLWGGMSGLLPALEPIARALYAGQAHRWHDQEFLSRVVWPLIRDHTLIHDSDYRLFDAKPFPIARPADSWRHIGGAVPVSQQTIVVKPQQLGVAKPTAGRASDKARRTVRVKPPAD